MTSELVRREPAASLPEKMEWARAMASSNLLPRQYQNNPGNLLFAVEYADALGVSRINAITSIHVIEGKPSASADLIASMVRKAGHRLRVSGDDTQAVAQLIRCDDPEFTYEARWDMAKARAAGLLGKGVWKNYPGAMLRSRAITEVARMGASDALFGVVYTPEELGAEVQADGTVVHTVTQVPPAGQRPSGSDRMRDVLGTSTTDHQQPEPQAEPAPAAEAPLGNEPEGITQAQIRKMGVLMKEAGLTDRNAALAYVAEVIGRPIASRNELTKAEAIRVINDLEQPPAAVPPADDEVVDAEIVGDDTNPDDVWKEIVAIGRTLHMTADQMHLDFAEKMGGLSASEAGLPELVAYRNMLTGTDA